MPVPALFQGRMAVPAIAAPMFLVSGPDLVINACKAGIAASFPSLNARPASQLDEWLTRMNAELGPKDAPFGINLILHHSNTRLEEDVALVAKHKVPFVITSLGNPSKLVEVVHSYGGLVFSDVIHAYHAKKAAEAGVDGIIAVSSGAGGHAGTQNPLALLREIREFWDGVLILGGAISDGASIRAAEIAGADFAYMGTRFIATAESMAQQAYKDMLVSAGPRDIVYTDAVSGTNANFIWQSLEKAGYTKESLAGGAKANHDYGGDEAKAWRDVWSAGHGVANIHDVLPVAELAARLATEYRQACDCPPSAALRRL